MRVAGTLSNHQTTTTQICVTQNINSHEPTAHTLCTVKAPHHAMCTRTNINTHTHWVQNRTTQKARSQTYFTNSAYTDLHTQVPTPTRITHIALAQSHITQCVQRCTSKSAHTGLYRLMCRVSPRSTCTVSDQHSLKIYSILPG